MAELGRFKFDNLIAGDYPTKTMEAIVKGPACFKRGDVVGKRNTDGALALVDSTKNDGTETVFGIICDDISVGEDEEKAAVVYIKGEFAEKRLTFGGNDTAKTHIDAIELQGNLFEKVLKQIIKTTVEELSADNRKRKIEDYPITLQACHIMEILDISQGKAYEIMRRKDCPTFRDEKRMLVPRDLFWKFILTEAAKGTDFEGVEL